MSPSLDGTLPEYVISQEDNSPLTLNIPISIKEEGRYIFMKSKILFKKNCVEFH